MRQRLPAIGSEKGKGVKPVLWKTSEVSKFLGVDRSVLHYYESLGMIRTQRGPNNYRGYDLYDLITLCNVRHVRTAGFTLEEAGSYINSPSYHHKIELAVEKEKALTLEIERLEQQREYLRLIQRNYKGPTEHENTISDYQSTGFVPLEYVVGEGPECQASARSAAFIADKPFSDYGFYVPPGGLLEEENYTLAFGFSFNPCKVGAAAAELPPETLLLGGTQALHTVLLKSREDPLLQYADFDDARRCCGERGLTLTGEAIIYATMLNSDISSGCIHYAAFLSLSTK